MVLKKPKNGFKKQNGFKKKVQRTESDSKGCRQDNLANSWE